MTDPRPGAVSTTARGRSGHNVQVIPPPAQRVRTALLAALLVPLLALSGCGGASISKKAPASKPTTSLPTGNVKVPTGVALTEPGTKLRFGQSGVVAFEANSRKGSVLSLRVDSVQTGSIADLSAYQLDAAIKRSRPYYARVSVRNIGTGDLGGSEVPLLAVDSRNALVQPSSFTNSFTRCPSTRLPATFGPGQSLRTCLVYLVPADGTLTAMSYRPLQAFEPITWTGTIAPVAAEKPSKKKAGKR